MSRHIIIDDVAVHDNSWESHLKHLDYVLSAFQNDGLTLKLSKCSFAKGQVKFIGHIIGSGTVQPVSSKIQGINDMPCPTTKKLLRSL